MTTQIKRRRGTTLQHSTFVGAEAEITIDTDKDTVVVHDGTTAGGHPLAKASEVVAKAGDTMTGDLTFGDNDKAIFGAGSDLQIYHDGSDSYIDDAGQGSLAIRGSATVSLQNYAGGLMVRGNAGADTLLYHNGNAKLATTATGVDITGTLTSDGLTVDGANDIVFSSGGNNIRSDGTIQIQADADGSGAGVLRLRTQSKTRQQIDNNGDISFYEDTGTTPKFFWDASAESLGIGTDSPALPLTIIGDDGDPASSGSTATGALQIQQGTNDVVLEAGVKSNSDRYAWIQATNKADHSSSYNISLNPNGGNVGIGTSSPFYPLSVRNTSFATVAEFRTIDGTNNPGLEIKNGASGTTLAQIYSSGASASLMLETNGSERMRIDSSGNLLVGTTTSDQANNSTAANAGIALRPSGSGALQVSRDGAHPATFNRLTDDGDIVLFRKDGTTVGSIASYVGSDIHIGTGDTRLRFVDSLDYIRPANSDGTSRDGLTDLGISTARFKDLYLSGDVFVNKTTKTASGSGIVLDGNGFAYFVRDGAVQILLGNDDTGGTSQEAIRFVRASSDVGSIDTTSTSTSYNTSSDYRLKTDVQPITGATDRFKQLNPVNFQWIADGTRVDGFIAHEAQAVVPEAVTGTKDAMRDEEYEVTPAVYDEEGNIVTEAVMGTRQVPDYQGIDQSKLVPLLTAALQEALTEIADLKARVAALEA